MFKVFGAFDAMSNGQIALERAKVIYDEYLASEVDKTAIKVAMSNYPQTRQLGDITLLEKSDFPKIDLMIGGSPCQSFSFAGKKNGMTTIDKLEVVSLEQYLELKHQGFQFMGQSYLFWEYVRLLNDLKPTYFLLENVQMAEKWERVLSEALGVEPYRFNSDLVSPQNRKRLYWTNIPDVPPIEPKNIGWSQICEDGWFAGAMRGRRINEEGKRDDFNLEIPFVQYIESRLDDKTNCLTTARKDNIVSKQRVGRTALTDVEWRYMTRTEMEMLQTVPVGYTNAVSVNQASKMLGNGWTVDIIAHFFEAMKKDMEHFLVF